MGPKPGHGSPVLSWTFEDDTQKKIYLVICPHPESSSIAGYCFKGKQPEDKATECEVEKHYVAAKNILIKRLKMGVNSGDGFLLESPVNQTVNLSRIQFSFLGV